MELISPEAVIINREIVRMDNGLGNGDFKLSDSIPDGNYRIRAYTNWMRNFGDNFVFENRLPFIIFQVPQLAKMLRSLTEKHQ